MGFLWMCAATVSVWCLLGVLLLGSVVFRAHCWYDAFHHLALIELQRRGLMGEKLSIEERAAANAMLAPGPTRTENRSEPPLSPLPLLTVLSGYENSRALASHVVVQRRSLLWRMMDRQYRLAARFRTLRWTSRVWVVHRRISRFEVAVRGVAWLLPRVLGEVVAIVKKYSTHLTVVAVFGGLSYWLFARDHSNAAAAPDMIGLITKTGAPALVFWAVGVLLYRALVAYVGPPSTWSKRNAVKALWTLVLGSAAVATVEFAGRRFGGYTQKWLDHVNPDNPTHLRVGSALFSVGFLWLASKSARGIRDRGLLMSERIRGLSVCVVLVSISIPTAALAAHGSIDSWERTAMITTFATALCIGLAGQVCRAAEWVGRCRRLARDGVEIPGKRLLQRVLTGWCLLLLVLIAGSVVPVLKRNEYMQFALILPGLVVCLGAIPLWLAMVQFVRRVNTEHEIHRTLDWPAHRDDETAAMDSSASSRLIAET